MNANELADKLEDATTDPFQVVPWFKALNQQVATMLRQQQAEIEALKDCKNQYQEVNRNILNDLMVARKRIEQLLETQDYLYKTHDKDKAEIEAFKNKECSCNVNTVNNEPVAWMDKETGCFVYSQYDYEDLDEHGKDGLIPLYTHPVKELTLTEDEIDDVWASCSTGESEFIDMHLFAEAILRKAHSNCNGFCGEYECKENQAGCKRKLTHSSDCGCERVMHECSEKDNCRMLTILRKASEK